MVIAPAVAALAALFGTSPFLIAIFILGVLLYVTKENRVVAAVVFSASVTVGLSVGWRFR